MIHGELFAGISGFAEAFRRAGVPTAYHVEIDVNCQRVERRHFPGTLILPDVCEAGAHNLPHVDVLSFGSPCQDLSVAGKRAGLVGERSGLFYEAIRIIRECHPTFAVWENVPGALSSHSGRDFAAVLSAFRECGARDIAWRILDAQYFGVAQRRRRVFVVADFGGERAAEILFERDGRTWDSPPRREAGARVAASAVSGAVSAKWAKGTGGPSGDEAQNLIALQCHGSNVGEMGTLRSGNGGLTGGVPFVTTTFNGYTGGADDNDARGGHQVPAPIPFDETQITSPGNYSNPQPGDPSHPLASGARLPTIAFSSKDHGTDAAEDIAPTLRSMNYDESHLNGGGQVAVAFALRGREDGAQVEVSGDSTNALRGSGGGSSRDYVAAFEPRYYTRDNKTGGAPGETVDITNTKKAGDSAPHIAAPFGVRRLTPRECERLQGFPDSWTEWGIDADGRRVEMSDSTRYRMCGNAVAVPVVEWIARRIMEAA